jgi:hypothetical protein
MGLRLTTVKIPSRAFVRRQSASIEASLVRARLERLAGRRLTREGVLVINARRHRTQERNREDARECLFDLIRRAAVAPRARRSTKPTPPPASAGSSRKSAGRRSKACAGQSRRSTSVFRLGSSGQKGCIHALLGERPSHFCLPHGPRAIEKIDHFGFVLPNRGVATVSCITEILQSQGQRYRNALEKHVTATDIASAVAYTNAHKY